MYNQDNKKVIDNAKFYTLSAAVYAVLEDLQAGEERFNQFLKFAIDGYQEFHFDASHEIVFEIIEMKPWKQIDFPGNMVDWTKVGFKTGNGITVFTQDSNIPKHFDKVNCVPQENRDVVDIKSLTLTDDIVPFFTDDYFFGGSHFYGALAQYNYAGYFDVDWTNRVINFKRTVKSVSHVYLEYITDGINPSGRTVIHPYAFKCIQNYIHWQRKEHDDRFSDNQAQRAKDLYDESFQDVLVRNLNLTIEDIKEALRAGHKQTPKG